MTRRVEPRENRSRRGFNNPETGDGFCRVRKLRDRFASVTHLEYPKRCAEVFICPHDRRHDHYSLQAPSFSLLPFPRPERAVSSSLPVFLSVRLLVPLLFSPQTPRTRPLGSSDSEEPRGTAYHGNGLCVSYISRVHGTHERVWSVHHESQPPAAAAPACQR